VKAVDGEADRAAHWSSPALGKTALGCKKTKLGRSVSCRESWWGSRSTGPESGGGVGGCRRWPGGTTEVGRGGVIGAEGMSENVCVQMQEQVC
jgi:hypothetical protein